MLYLIFIKTKTTQTMNLLDQPTETTSSIIATEESELSPQHFLMMLLAGITVYYLMEQLNVTGKVVIVLLVQLLIVVFNQQRLLLKQYMRYTILLFALWNGIGAALVYLSSLITLASYGYVGSGGLAALSFFTTLILGLLVGAVIGVVVTLILRGILGMH